MTTNYEARKIAEARKKNANHPIFYVIGCVMTIITPIISWAATMVVLDYGKSQNWSFIYQLGGTVRFPDIVYKIPVISTGANFLSGIPYLEAMVMFFLLFVILLSGLFAMLNAFLFRMFGPPRYSSIDAPPPARKAKRRSR